VRQPSIFIPHGGGPCFFMAPPRDDPQRWVAMAAYLRAMPGMLPGKPDALLVVSAHWEQKLPTILTKAAPGLLFDYYNFPPETYRLTYPAPGAPALGARVREMLAAAGIESAEDGERDYDHGVFIPLKVSFPEADVPILQLSLQVGLDPAQHIAVGRALAGLRDENVLVIGSGLSFHNLRELGDPATAGPAAAFDAWLVETLCVVSPQVRETRLIRWFEAPGARICHPREEHLLPLMVAAGAGLMDRGMHAFNGTIFGKAVSAFHFQ
jgi:aromatic ring-opening dioxygenase catalytic subunit (LigB family)